MIIQRNAIHLFLAFLIAIGLVGCEGSKFDTQAILINNYILLDPLTFDYTKVSKTPIKQMYIKKIIKGKVLQLTQYNYQFNNQGLIVKAEITEQVDDDVVSKQNLQFTKDHTWELTQYMPDKSTGEWQVVLKSSFIIDNQGMISQEEQLNFKDPANPTSRRILYFFSSQKKSILEMHKKSKTSPYFFVNILYQVNEHSTELFKYDYEFYKLTGEQLSKSHTILHYQSDKIQLNEDKQAVTEYITSKTITIDGAKETDIRSIRSCVLLDLNQQGDWLEKKCDGRLFVIRELTY